MALNSVTRTIALLYKFQESEVEEYAQRLITAKTQAYKDAINEQLRRTGCPKTANNPAGADLRHIRAAAREEAAGIIKTWNADVEKQLTRLYAENPRGNRQFYISRMEAWAERRDAQKSLSIALNSTQEARGYAKERFAVKNKIEAKFRFVGPPAVCSICLKLFAKGKVSLAFVKRNPCPRHPNCPHEWEQLTSTQSFDCAEVWAG